MVGVGARVRACGERLEKAVRATCPKFKGQVFDRLPIGTDKVAEMVQADKDRRGIAPGIMPIVNTD